MSGEAEVRPGLEVSEAEEIRAILGAVSYFLKELTPTIKGAYRSCIREFRRRGAG